MIGRSGKKYSSVPKKSRVLAFKDVLAFEATLEYARVINVIVDKQGKRFGFNAFETAWDALINRFENTMRHQNFPHPYEGTEPFVEKGLLIVDETDEPKLRSLIRRMRHGNLVPSSLYPGSEVRSDLERVIEDPLHKKSDYSPLIQLADANAYFLKQTLETNATVKKYKAKNYFYSLEPILLKQASSSNEFGIVRL